jgi:catechol 2,3-dioxygenase
VQLVVADLPRSVRFYQEQLGMEPQGRGAGSVALGASGGEPVLILEEHRGAQRPRAGPGLYHFALLVPSRAELARTLEHLIISNTPLQGLSDHAVSEAIYLADPEGNGIEIYADRPRASWPWVEGALQMSTEPLDIASLMEERGGAPAWSRLPAGTTMGHVHLQVTDVPPAETFYRDVLGFDLTTRYGKTASFLATGGYHHHVAVNSWQSRGASQRPNGAAGLAHFTLRLPREEMVRQVVSRARAAGAPVEDRNDGTLVRDPSGNALVLTALG